MTEKILFIGGCGHGKPTTNGVAAKNYYLLSRLKELSTDVKTVDTDGWKRNPLIFPVSHQFRKIIRQLFLGSSHMGAFCLCGCYSLCLPFFDIFPFILCNKG